MRLRELRIDGGANPKLVVDLGGAVDEVDLDDFREIIRERVRRAADQARPANPFAIDLNIVPDAEVRYRAKDWAGVVELLGAWPGPLSLLLRTAEGQELSGPVKSTLARALGLLGTAYVRQGKHEWAEEVMRLGIQWGQDGPASGDLFRRLGEAHVARDRHGEAIGLLRRALALGAPPEDALPLLAACYANREKFVAARVCVEEALAAGVSTEEVAEVQAACDEAQGEAWARLRKRVPAPGS